MKKNKEFDEGMGNERGSKKKFRRGLTVYLLILSLLLGGALYVLWGFLGRYQANQDKLEQEQLALAEQKQHEKDVYRAPQLCFESFFSGTDADYWTDEWFTSHPDSTDVREKVHEEFERLFFGEDTACFKALSYTDQKPVYVIKNSEMELATVSLSGSELDWTVSNVNIELEAKESASIEVPTGCTVYCNGVALDPALAADAHSYFEMEELKDSLKNPVEWVTYKVDGLLFPPELTAEAPADKTLFTDEEGNMRYILAADAAGQYQQQGEKMIKQLLYYYMQGGSNTYGNMQAVLPMLVPGSQAYKLVQDSANGVSWDASYPNATYEATAGDVVIWADNCMSMDVKYHAEGTTGGYTNVADGTYVLFFVDSGNGYGICGLSYK